MKIAVLADIHANFAALQAIDDHVQAWKPDQVIIAGDLVNRGPRPLECLNLVQDRQHSQGWLLLRGNHEEYVINQTRTEELRSEHYFDVHRASYWTYCQLGGDVSALQAMPFQQVLRGPDGRQLQFVHASIRGTRDGIYPHTSDRELAPKIGLNGRPGETPAVFCVGHTHRPLVRMFQGILVVNAGSAGLPFDGDTRPAYAQISWQHGEWQARIVRVDYDLHQAERDFLDSRYWPEAGPLVELVRIELLNAQSMLYNWSIRYQDLALAGKISMEESVRRFLAS